MQNHRKIFLGVIAATVSAGLSASVLAGANVISGHMVLAEGYGMGGGMMGGMMGPGMMGQAGGDGGSGGTTLNPARANALAGYIRAQHLPCMQCHSITGNGFGPSFDRVSALYAGRPDASGILESHIAHGYGRMPPGLATEIQSASLAKMILGLTGAMH